MSVCERDCTARWIEHQLVTVLVSLSGVGVVVELGFGDLCIRLGHSSCKLIVQLQENLPVNARLASALVVYRQVHWTAIVVF